MCTANQPSLEGKRAGLLFANIYGRYHFCFVEKTPQIAGVGGLAVILLFIHLGRWDYKKRYKRCISSVSVPRLCAQTPTLPAALKLHPDAGVELLLELL